MAYIYSILNIKNNKAYIGQTIKDNLWDRIRKHFEKLRTNTSILRRLINTPDLIIESTTVGKANKTQVAVCYMKNIANSSLISEVKYRLANLDVDYVISSRKC